MKLFYSKEAVEDLKHLRQFIAEQDSIAAAKVGEQLVSRINYLCAFPELGKCVERSPTPEVIRDFTFGNYIVRYTLHSSAIVILRIWHHYESRE